MNHPQYSGRITSETIESRSKQERDFFAECGAELAAFGLGQQRGVHSRQDERGDECLAFYTYSMQRPLRIVYFIKTIYSDRFTWMPDVAQGQYHPQYFGRSEIKTVEVIE
jgi:hypothetical protein